MVLIRPAVLYNLGSGSWLAWANDTMVQCFIQTSIDRHSEQLDPQFYTTDIPPRQSAARPSPHSPHAAAQVANIWTFHMQVWRLVSGLQCQCFTLLSYSVCYIALLCHIIYLVHTFVGTEDCGYNSDSCYLQWDDFSLPELKNFLMILDKEEQRQISRIRQNFLELRVRMTERMKQLFSVNNPDSGNFSRCGPSMLY